MVSLAFDTLQFARKLAAAGVPKKQAEAQAEAMGGAFGFYVDNLVTRDYLDARLDARFAEQDARIDQRLAEQDTRLDKRFTKQDERIGQFQAAMELRFSELRGELSGELKLHRWILAAIAASTVIPALGSLLRWA